MYAGGISYFSNGSAWRPLGTGICPEALARDISELKQVKMVTEAVEDLIFGYVIASFRSGSCRIVEAIHDCPIPNPLAGAFPVVQNREIVEVYLRSIS